MPPDQTGVASGMNANIRTIGGAIGAALMSSIVGSSAEHGELPTEAGYTHGFIMPAVAELLAGWRRAVHSGADAASRDGN